MSRFLRFCAFLSVLFFSANAMAAGYLCPTYRKYTSCNAGYYLNGTGIGNACVKCPAGTYQPSNGSNATSCTKCAVGAYNTGTGNTACLPCTNGYTNTTTGSTGCGTKCANNNGNVSSWMGEWVAASNTALDICGVDICKSGYERQTLSGDLWYCNANQYTVKYNGNSSTSGSMSNGTFYYNTEQALANNGFSRTGYTFQGWARSSSATTAEYANAASVKFTTNSSGTIYADGTTINLYATWSANDYYIKYFCGDEVDGIANGGNTTAKYNSSFTYAAASACTGRKSGYTQTGWTSTTTGAKGLGASETWSYATDVDMQAVWQPNNYTVSFNANGGSGGQSANVTATYSAAMPTISTTKPTKTACKFNGWYDATSGGKQYYSAAGASVRSYDKTSNTTLYAQWSCMSVSAAAKTLTYNGTTTSNGTAQSCATTFTVSGPSNYTVTYSASSSGTYSGTAPTLTSAGSKTVYYKIAATDYTSYAGSYTCTMNTKAMTVSASNKTKVYDGSALTCSVSVSVPSSGATIKYGTSSGSYTLTSAPTQTNVGSQTVYYQVTGNNFTTKTGSFTCSVTKATMNNPSLAGNSKTYNGSALTCDGGTQTAVPGNSTITYSTTNGSGYSSTKPTRTNAGTTTVYYKITNNNYNDFTGSFSCTVNKAAGTTTLGATSGTLTYPTTSGSFTASCSESATPTVSLSTSTYAGATYSSGKVNTTWKAADGTTTITVNCPASTNYNASSKTYTLYTKKAANPITLSASSGTIAYPNSTTFTVSNAQGTLSVSSNATGVATASLSSTTVTVKSVKPGSATITVTAEGNSYYYSGSKTYAATVSKGTNPIKLSADSGSINYNGTGTFTVSGAQGTLSVSPASTTIATASLSGTTVTMTGKQAGTTTITVTAAGNDYYNSGSKTYSLTVNKIASTTTVSKSSMTITYPTTTGTFTASCNSGATPTVSSNATSVATVSFSSGTATVTWKAAGSATITVNCEATTNYNASSKTVAVTIAKGTNTLALSETSGTLSYTSSVKTKTFTVKTNTSGGALSVSSNATGVATAAISGTTVTMTYVKAGAATITVTSAATSYYNAASVTYALTINCGAGYYSKSAACTVCPVGTYTSSANTASSCTNVNAGCYADTTGSTSSCPKSCSALGGKLYVNSNAGSDSENDCYFTTTAGKYLVASTDTAQTECPVGQYCTAETLSYPNVSELNSGGGWNDCPAVSGRQMTTFPDDYKVYDTNTTSIYSSTVSVAAISLQKWSTGQTSASQCRAVYSFSNDAGNFVDESVRYNPSTDKYDIASGNQYYTTLKGGYYAMTRYSATYCDNRKETDAQKTLYSKAVVCPANSYCPAVSSFPKCYGNEYTETYNNNLCTSLGSFYTTSAKKSSAASQCYGTTTAGKYIATANSSTQTTCPAGSYCPATNVYYGKYGTSAGGQNLCPAGKYNAATGKSLSTDCIACAIGSYAVGTGNSSCTACAAGTTTTGTGHTSATCSSCANNNDYDNAWETPSWAANAVTNLCEVKNCKAGSKYSSATGTNTTGSCTACGAGTYMASSAHTNTSCTSAAKGYYVSGTGATGQTACTGAQYQDATGQASCKDCPSGYTANTTNAKTAATQCQISCAAGTRVAEKAAACTSPAGGWFTTATHLVNYNNVSNVNYCMAGFSSSSTAATGHDAKADCTQSVAGGKYIPTTTIQARYIKVTTAGSTANAGSHVVEIQAFASADGSGTNLLSGKGGVLGSNMTAATDGSWAIGNYASGTMVWDMGSAQALGSIKFALYTDGRVYSDVTVSVSTDNSTWTTVLGPVDVATSITSTATPEMIVLSAAPASCAAGKFKAAASVALGSTTTCGTCANWTYSGEGAASCTSCPTVESGYAKLDSTGTGWTTYTKCVEIASASPSNCSAGKLQKIPTASGATTWASPTVNSSNPLSANAGYYVSGTQCAACGGSNYYCTGGTAAPKTVTTGYYSTGGTSTTRTGQSQCTDSTYCVSGEQKNCPTAETNWTLGTGTGWSAVTSCFETRAATNVSSNCSAGQLKKNATSSAAWPTSANISVAFQANPGSIVSGQTCVQCTGATYSAGGTATQCSACDTNYQANTSAGKSVATQCQIKCAAGTAVVTANNACADIKNSTYKGKFTTEHLVNYGSKSSISTCPTSYQDGNGTTAQANCINSCAAGTQVATANADCSTPSNTTYGASWYTSAHNVTYGKTSKSMSLVGSCPSTYTTPDTTTASNHDAKSDCTTTCAAGKVVASADAACSVPSGSWYSAQHTVSAGSTSGTNKKSCNSGYATANTTTQTDHDAAADCKISCSAGYYIPTAGEGCKVCTAGKYCSAISNIAQTSTSAVTGNVSAGYWNNGCGTNATGSVCSTSYSGGLIAAGYYGTAGATASTGSGTVSGGYYSTGGGTSATPSSNGNGCVGTDNTCGKLSAAYYSNGGSTTNGATCVSGKVCGTCDSNYRANTNTGKTAVTQCQTQCAAGTAVVTENKACADIKNSTYKGKYTAQHNVAYGSVSTIQSCPTYYQDSSVGVAGEANCINSCVAGTQVATANADCSTPNTANWYTDAHNVTYGKTSANLNKVVSCDSDYSNSGTTAANHAGVTSCKVTCPAGTWVASANAACTDVASGYYRTTSETVSQTKTGTRSACTDLGAIYTASDGGRDATTDCFATTTAKKWVAAAKATAESTCTEGYYCGGGTKVYYNSTGGRKVCAAGSFCVAGVSESTACAVGSYTSTTGQSACTACTNGKTTSEAGKTSCDATCANASGANAWSTASWTNNTVANLCTISKCNANTYYTATTATGYKNTCTACGANSSTSAGNTSTTCTCTTGYTSTGKVGGAATSTSGCSLISDIACAIGQYVPAKATSCSACTEGYYCPSTAKTYSYSSSIQGRTACSPGTYQPDTGKTSCVKASLGYYVSGSAQTEQTACSGATYAATEGQSQCTSCPTAKNNPGAVVVGYNYYHSDNGDTTHKYREGCYVKWGAKTLDDGSLTNFSCYIDQDEEADTYGVDGTSKWCWNNRAEVKCNGGYYSAKFDANSSLSQAGWATVEDLHENICESVTAGYWSADESLNRTACATGLTTIGYGTAANEAEDCGRKLHAGNNVVYLRSGQRSTPTLKVKIGDDVFYGALSTSLSGALKVKKGTTEYSVVNDWQ